MSIIPDEKRQEIEMKFNERLFTLLDELETIHSAIRMAQEDRLRALELAEAEILEAMAKAEMGRQNNEQ